MTLDVTVDNGRLEDMIRLATKAGQPVLRGPLVFKTAFDLPPGEGDIMDRLQLEGSFHHRRGALHQSRDPQKTSGPQPPRQRSAKDQNAGSDVSRLSGRFRLREGVLALSGLTFQVEGAAVQLDGTYGLRTKNWIFAAASGSTPNYPRPQLA